MPVSEFSADSLCLISLKNEKTKFKVALRKYLNTHSFYWVDVRKYLNTHSFYSVDELFMYKDGSQWGM
jgi:hypothetical protein